MTIYITGDIHGELGIHRLNSRNWPVGRTLTKSDYVIILGDFGLVYNWKGESPEERYWLDWLERKPWTTLFIDGNHENFDRLFSDEFDVRPWMGGQARFIRESVIHLIRGEIYEIDGLSFLAFGGANSVDKGDRTPGESWWPQEDPDFEERGYCFDNLAAHGNKVDVVLTHDCPEGALRTWPLASYRFKSDDVSNWLQSSVADAVKFRRWFYGHYHIDEPDARPCTPLFNEIVELEFDAPMGEDDYARVFASLF